MILNVRLTDFSRQEKTEFLALSNNFKKKNDFLFYTQKQKKKPRNKDQYIPKPSLTGEAHFHLRRRVAVRIGLRPGGTLAPPPVPMLNIGAPAPLAIPKGPPGAAAGLAAPANENAPGGPPPAAFEPAEKLNAGGGDVAAAPKIPPPAAAPAGVPVVGCVGVPKENGLTVAVLLAVVLLGLKEKDELPVLPNAGGGAPVLLLFWLVLLALEKLKLDATGAAADEFDPAEKPKLLAGFAAGVDVGALPIPPKENGLFAAGATEGVEAGAAGAAPNENCAEPEVALG